MIKPVFFLFFLIADLAPYAQTGASVSSMNKFNGAHSGPLADDFSMETIQLGEFWQVVIKDSFQTVRIRSTYLDKQRKTLHGPYNSYHSNGKPASSGTFSMGLKDGVWINIYANGRIKDSIQYKNGLMHGPYKKFYPDGQLQTSGYFNENFASGIWQSYHDNSMPASVRDYDRGQLVSVKYFTRDGEKIEEVQSGLIRKKQQIVFFDWYLEKENELRYAFFYSKPRKLESGQYETVLYTMDGHKTAVLQFTDYGFRKKNGPFVKYDENDQVIIETYFVHNQLSGPFRKWHPNRILSDSGQLFKGEQAGVWQSWYINGQKKDSGEYKQGVKTGLWTEWDATGEQKSLGMYSRGYRTGDWKYYNQNGRILFVRRFKKSGYGEAERVNITGN